MGVALCRATHQKLCVCHGEHQASLFWRRAKMKVIPETGAVEMVQEAPSRLNRHGTQDLGLAICAMAPKQAAFL